MVKLIISSTKNINEQLIIKNKNINLPKLIFFISVSKSEDFRMPKKEAMIRFNHIKYERNNNNYRISREVSSKTS